ncbi:hypothetical protein BKA70DRAFT_1567980 [Coprinopsis sp. MPI-PUGE-AT-0042]|nr:hypothetical protein BKA70DRAFT_1567980 [Coprinopsis sp. MPI-PUGE-AT-0042]
MDDNPDQLQPYTEANTQLPAHLEPNLATFLDQLSASITVLDTEISNLERQLCTKREAQAQIMKIQKAYSRIRAPIRRIPPELLALIYGYVLGTEPFGSQEYRRFAYLRGVCKTWRSVVETTPHLCPGLKIDLTAVNQFRRPGGEVAWDDEGQPQDRLAPWLACVARSPGYHLVVKPKGERTIFHPDNNKALLKHLAISQPSAGKLTIHSREAGTSLFELDVSFPEVKVLEILGFTPRLRGNMPCLAVLFPQLSTLIARCQMTIDPTFQHTSLQTLHLEDISGDETDFAQLLYNIPCLQELKVSSTRQLNFPEGWTMSPASLSHPSLETLLLDGQDMFALLYNITFPALKLLRMDGMILICPEELHEQHIPQFLRQLDRPQRSLTVSLGGLVDMDLVDAFLNHLPPRTRLHFDMKALYHGSLSVPAAPGPPIPIESDQIEDIFCTETTGDLQWLQGPFCRRVSSRPIKLYVSSIAADRHQVETKRAELQAWGYELEVHPTNVLNSLFCSSIPHTDLDWF